MADREKVIRGLEACASQTRIMQCEACPYHTDKSRCVTTLMCDAHALLRDTTNPKGGSCSTCIHEYEPGRAYCLTHQKCKVCGICSGYEGGDDDA